MTQAFPLQWPEGWRRSSDRKRAQFGSTSRQYSTNSPGVSWTNKKELSVSQGIHRVLWELERLGVPAGEAIISTNLQVRLDGLPRSGQSEPGDPGAAVYWRKRPQDPTTVMAIDRYDRVADNLAAIAATLEAMRAIERHGGAQILERAFTGFAALSSPDDPWAILNLKPGAGREEIQARFRELAKNHHPDAAGGSGGAFAKISWARDQVLKAVP